MRPNPPECPQCGYRCDVRARVDSDDRIESTWLLCGACGWDQRHGAPVIEPDMSNVLPS